MRQVKNIEIKINLPMDFLQDWEKEQIEFYLNDSSYCCDNLIDLLQEYSKKYGCICSITSCKVVDDNN